MADLHLFLQEMQRFRASDEARERLVNEVLAKYSTLSEEHFILKNDYASERDIRRNYQSTVEEKQSLIREYERQLESSSFVLALIDGDGAIFEDALLQAAAGDGGSEAASRLYQAIRNHVAAIYSNSGNWPVMVQIYLSLDKLAMKLAQVGLLRAPQELRAFAQRFSVNQPLFSIIDVGQGKERADHKIKGNFSLKVLLSGALTCVTEMLRTFSDNPTCRHIIFGGCHDAGYLLNLEHFKHNPSKAARITLLETTPAYRGFAELSNFTRARFDDVFKTGPLPDYAPPPLSKSGAPANGSISIAPSSNTKTNTKKKYAYYNKAEQRLDEALPPRDPAAAASLEARMKKTGKKMCNHWHLGGHCENGKFCNFQHEPKLSPAELNALRYKTHLGHQCALERDQGYCPYPDNCHLRGTHGMDRVKHVRYDKDGNADYAP
ncbi:hypothetical protein N0V83_005626 [Neocucurbitaria cava]|uniref:C3H1-type domain-containing protein n=1 Tax=Neocucurbitaria cava TaxID=798079 RepID=A0A9W8Y7Q9_9PLEO|nr:hypothetical protein N0V83_005626 [Neocucurbitaria cava]